jgi:hypothetical protein
MISNYSFTVFRRFFKVKLPFMYTKKNMQNQGCGSGSVLFWEAGSVSGSACKSNFRSFRGSKWSLGGPWMLALRLKMEPYTHGIFLTVVADSQR